MKHPRTTTMKHARTLLTALLLAPLAVLHAQSPQKDVAGSVFGGDTVEVSVRFDTAREINGVSIVPDGLFGVTAYNGPASRPAQEAVTLSENSGSFSGQILRSSASWIPAARPSRRVCRRTAGSRPWTTVRVVQDRGPEKAADVRD